MTEIITDIYLDSSLNKYFSQPVYHHRFYKSFYDVVNLKFGVAFWIEDEPR